MLTRRATGARAAAGAPGQRAEGRRGHDARGGRSLRLYTEEDLAVGGVAKHGFEEATGRRVVRLVDLAEDKRRQSPPGIKITPRAFGKDRRLPITNRWQG